MSTPDIERTGSALAIDPSQSSWTPEQKAAVLQACNLASNTPQAQLDIFFHIAQRSKLDPFRRGIYMIARATKEYDPQQNRKIDVIKYTIQTGIDGFRSTGARVAREQRKTFKKPVMTFIDDDGEERKFWVGKKDPETGVRQPPVAVRAVGTDMNGEPIDVLAYYDEFVQLIPESIWRDKPDGSGRENHKTGNMVPNSMWAKMPVNQLAKCAEALWYRRAFPDDLGGLYTEDEIDPNGPNVVNGVQAEVLSETRDDVTHGGTWEQRIAAIESQADGAKLWDEMVAAGAKTTARAAAIHARVLEVTKQPDGAGEGGEESGDSDAEGTTPAPDGDESTPLAPKRYCMHGVRALHNFDGWYTTCRECVNGVEWAEGEAPDA